MLCVNFFKGLESYWERHRAAAQSLYKGLDRLGLQLFVKDEVGCLSKTESLVIWKKFVIAILPCISQLLFGCSKSDDDPNTPKADVVKSEELEADAVKSEEPVADAVKSGEPESYRTLFKAQNW